MAPPVTYELDGEQYVAVMAGWGGAFALVGRRRRGRGGRGGQHRAPPRLEARRHGSSCPCTQAAARELAAVPADFDAALVKRGNQTYHRWCATCHGVGAVSGGVLPDLRQSDARMYGMLDDVVLRGALLGNGHAALRRVARAATTSSAIRAYLLTRRAALLAEKE